MFIVWILYGNGANLLLLVVTQKQEKILESLYFYFSPNS